MFLRAPLFSVLLALAGAMTTAATNAPEFRTMATCASSSGFGSKVRIHCTSSSRSPRPKVLTRPWTTTRLFVRRRGPQFDIVEGQCVQGELVEAVDEHGNAIFEHAPPPDDGRVPIGR